MIVQFRKWGNSLAVRIPKAAVQALRAKEGKKVEIKIKGSSLILRPVVKPMRKQSYTMKKLLAGMTRDNVPQEIDWGVRRGNEVW